MKMYAPENPEEPGRQRLEGSVAGGTHWKNYFEKMIEINVIELSFFLSDYLFSSKVFYPYLYNIHKGIKGCPYTYRHRLVSFSLFVIFCTPLQMSTSCVELI